MSDLTRFSKLLSYVQRHRPDELDIELDSAGWTDATTLLDALKLRAPAWDRELLEPLAE